MVQLLPTIFSFLILLTWPSYLIGASPITLEDKLQQLTDNYKLMEDKMSRMESKNSQLETQFQELQEEFATKLTQLESKVQEQEMLLNALQRPTALNSVQMNNNDETYSQSKAMPTSCEDLRLIGHIWSGLYSVRGTKTVDTVYCDFTKLPSDSDFEQRIGYVDIKSAIVYFYAQRNADGFSQTNTPIIFDLERLNSGGAYSSINGKFTAPADGKYYFSFTGLVKFPGNPSLLRTDIGLYKNNVFIGFAQSDAIVNSGFQYETLSLQSTLELAKGDQVWMSIASISAGVTIEGNYYTHFNGFLLEQNLF